MTARSVTPDQSVYNHIRDVLLDAGDVNHPTNIILRKQKRHIIDELLCTGGACPTADAQIKQALDKEDLDSLNIILFHPEKIKTLVFTDEDGDAIMPHRVTTRRLIAFQSFVNYFKMYMGLEEHQELDYFEFDYEDYDAFVRSAFKPNSPVIYDTQEARDNYVRNMSRGNTNTGTPTAVPTPPPAATPNPTPATAPVAAPVGPPESLRADSTTDVITIDEVPTTNVSDMTLNEVERALEGFMTADEHQPDHSTNINSSDAILDAPSPPHPSPARFVRSHRENIFGLDAFQACDSLTLSHNQEKGFGDVMFNNYTFSHCVNFETDVTDTSTPSETADVLFKTTPVWADVYHITNNLALSDATLAFRAQSMQFDTGTADGGVRGEIIIISVIVDCYVHIIIILGYYSMGRLLVTKGEVWCICNTEHSPGRGDAMILWSAGIIMVYCHITHWVISLGDELIGRCIDLWSRSMFPQASHQDIPSLLLVTVRLKPSLVLLPLRHLPFLNSKTPCTSRYGENELLPSQVDIPTIGSVMHQAARLHIPSARCDGNCPFGWGAVYTTAEIKRGDGWGATVYTEIEWGAQATDASILIQVGRIALPSPTTFGMRRDRLPLATYGATTRAFASANQALARYDGGVVDGTSQFPRNGAWDTSRIIDRPARMAATSVAYDSVAWGEIPLAQLKCHIYENGNKLPRDTLESRDVVIIDMVRCAPLPFFAHYHHHLHHLGCLRKILSILSVGLCSQHGVTLTLHETNNEECKRGEGCCDNANNPNIVTTYNGVPGYTFSIGQVSYDTAGNVCHHKQRYMNRSGTTYHIFSSSSRHACAHDNIGIFDFYPISCTDGNVGDVNLMYQPEPWEATIFQSHRYKTMKVQVIELYAHQDGKTDLMIWSNGVGHHTYQSVVEEISNPYSGRRAMSVESNTYEDAVELVKEDGERCCHVPMMGEKESLDEDNGFSEPRQEYYYAIRAKCMGCCFRSKTGICIYHRLMYSSVVSEGCDSTALVVTAYLRDSDGLMQYVREKCSTLMDDGNEVIAGIIADSMHLAEDHTNDLPLDEVRTADVTPLSTNDLSGCIGINTARIVEHTPSIGSAVDSSSSSEEGTSASKPPSGIDAKADTETLGYLEECKGCEENNLSGARLAYARDEGYQCMSYKNAGNITEWLQEYVVKIWRMFGIVYHRHYRASQILIGQESGERLWINISATTKHDDNYDPELISEKVGRSDTRNTWRRRSQKVIGIPHRTVFVYIAEYTVSSSQRSVGTARATRELSATRLLLATKDSASTRSSIGTRRGDSLWGAICNSTNDWCIGPNFACIADGFVIRGDKSPVLTKSGEQDMLIIPSFREVDKPYNGRCCDMGQPDGNDSTSSPMGSSETGGYQDDMCRDAMVAILRWRIHLTYASMRTQAFVSDVLRIITGIGCRQTLPNARMRSISWTSKYDSVNCFSPSLVHQGVDVIRISTPANAIDRGVLKYPFRAYDVLVCDRISYGYDEFLTYGRSPNGNLHESGQSKIHQHASEQAHITKNLTMML